jgi:hypothetical protein
LIFNDFAATSTGRRHKSRNHVADAPRPIRGVIDTSVLIDLEKIDASQLPRELALYAFTLAELAAGPNATGVVDERARRQDRLQRAEATFSALYFDADAARAYGRVFAAIAATGREARGARAVDLMTAATACSRGLPLFPRNPDDFRGLGGVVEVRAV